MIAEESGVDPDTAIRRRARALVTRALELGWEGPPFDMVELASIQRLNVAESLDFRADQDACVVPGLILVNANKTKVRQRYSVAHEIAHTLFPDYAATVTRAGKLWRREGDSSEFERLCQVGASELLLPIRPFVSAVGVRGRNVAGVIRLAAQFDASVEATARRLVETADERMLGIFLRPLDPDTGTWREVNSSDGHFAYAAVGISFVCASDQFGPIAVSRGARAPKRSAAERAWKRAALARRDIVVYEGRREDWSTAGISGRWDSEAMSLPKGSSLPHEVLCLMRPVDSSSDRT